MDTIFIICIRYWELRRPPRHGLGSVSATMAAQVHTDLGTREPNVNKNWWPAELKALSDRGSDGEEDAQEDVHSDGIF